MSEPIVCPHCHELTELEDLPEGYATAKWDGNVKEEPYVRCPLCTASFPVWGIEEYLAR